MDVSNIFQLVAAKKIMAEIYAKESASRDTKETVYKHYSDGFEAAMDLLLKLLSDRDMQIKELERKLGE